MKSLNVPRYNNTRIQNNRQSKVSSGQIDRLGASSVNTRQAVIIPRGQKREVLAALGNKYRLEVCSYPT